MVTQVFQELLQLAEIDQHASVLRVLRKPVSFDLCHDTPAVSVQISAFPFIVSQKMGCIKTLFRF